MRLTLTMTWPGQGPRWARLAFRLAARIGLPASLSRDLITGESQGWQIVTGTSATHLKIGAIA